MNVDVHYMINVCLSWFQVRAGIGWAVVVTVPTRSGLVETWWLHRSPGSAGMRIGSPLTTACVPIPTVRQMDTELSSAHTIVQILKCLSSVASPVPTLTLSTGLMCMQLHYNKSCILYIIISYDCFDSMIRIIVNNLWK